MSVDDWRPAKPKRVDRRPQDVLDREARLEAEARRDGDDYWRDES